MFGCLLLPLVFIVSRRALTLYYVTGVLSTKGRSPMDNNYDRLLKSSMLAFERLIENDVQREFNLLPDGACETPWIDEEFFSVGRVALKQLVIKARCCQRWFEFEAPR